MAMMADISLLLAKYLPILATLFLFNGNDGRHLLTFSKLFAFIGHSFPLQWQ